jgi:hypothetical protein
MVLFIFAAPQRIPSVHSHHFIIACATMQVWNMAIHQKIETNNDNRRRF